MVRLNAREARKNFNSLITDMPKVLICPKNSILFPFLKQGILPVQFQFFGSYGFFVHQSNGPLFGPRLSTIRAHRIYATACYAFVRNGTFRDVQITAKPSLLENVSNEANMEKFNEPLKHACITTCQY